MKKNPTKGEMVRELKRRIGYEKSVQERKAKAFEIDQRFRANKIEKLEQELDNILNPQLPGID